MTNTQALAARKRLKLRQADFWARVGVNQDTGCRYEKGRRMPRPVVWLLDIAYGDKVAHGKRVRMVRDGQ